MQPAGRTAGGGRSGPARAPRRETPPGRCPRPRRRHARPGRPRDGPSASAAEELLERLGLAALRGPHERTVAPARAFRRAIQRPGRRPGHLSAAGHRRLHATRTTARHQYVRRDLRGPCARICRDDAKEVGDATAMAILGCAGGLALAAPAAGRTAADRSAPIRRLRASAPGGKSVYSTLPVSGGTLVERFHRPSGAVLNWRVIPRELRRAGRRVRRLDHRPLGGRAPLVLAEVTSTSRPGARGCSCSPAACT